MSTLATVLIAAVVFAVARTTLIDDAYITLDYARNVAFHLHWGLIPAATSNTATSPLNVLVLALFTAVTRSPVTALGIVFVLSAVALEIGLRVTARTVGLPGWSGLLAVALVSVNPLLISSIGLEVGLGAGLFGLLLAAAATRRPVWFGLLSGLLLLTRPDLIIVVLAVFLGRRWYHGWWRSLLAAIGVTLPWYLFSWLALGSAIPTTLIIKLSQQSWGGYRFGNGPPLYYGAYPAATVLSFLPAAIGVLAALIWLVARLSRPSDRLRKLDQFAALPVAGVLYYLAYTVLGVPPYHWYYGPVIVWTTVYLAVVVAALKTPAVYRWAGIVTVVVVVMLSLVDYVGGGLPRAQAQITTNWAAPADYQRIGTAVGRLAGNRTVASFGEIGAIAYYCGCSMIDEFSDPSAAVGMINAYVGRSGPLTQRLLRWNFHFLDRGRPGTVADLALRYTSSPVPGALGYWPASSSWLGGQHYVSLVSNR